MNWSFFDWIIYNDYKLFLALTEKYFLWWLLLIFLHHNKILAVLWFPFASILERLLVGFRSHNLNLRWPYHLQSKKTYFCLSLILRNCLIFLFFSKMINVESLVNMIGSWLANFHLRSWSWFHFNILRPFKFSWKILTSFDFLTP